MGKRVIKSPYLSVPLNYLFFDGLLIINSEMRLLIGLQLLKPDPVFRFFLQRKDYFLNNIIEHKNAIADGIYSFPKYHNYFGASYRSHGQFYEVSDKIEK